MPQLCVLHTRTEGEKIHILQEIGTKYTLLGTILLNDKSGEITSAIERENTKNANTINYHILQKWVQGSGKMPVTWRTLLEVMKDIGLITLARKIELSVNEDASQECEASETVRTNHCCSIL